MPQEKGLELFKYFDKIEQKQMLLRVIGRETEKGFVVITVYKTSKIEKYWKGGI